MTGTPVSPDAARVWRAARGPLVVALLVVFAAIGLALLTGTDQGGALDPRSADPAGSRALARLLQAEGVRVLPVATTAEAVRASDAGATLLVTRPELLAQSQLESLRLTRPAQLVLIAPEDGALAELAPALRVAGHTDVAVREPGCTLAAAAGPARLGGLLYTGVAMAGRCYRVDDRAALVVLTDGGRQVIVLGSGAPMQNHQLAEAGNAALTMRLLGAHGTLVWYVPSLDDPALAGEQRSLSELVPAGWKYGVLQLAVAVVLVALWRARRLGPVVVEPLPVVVRAAETVEGHARLYRHAGARDRAAHVLRTAAVHRMVPLLGLPGTPERAAVVATIAARTGRDPAGVDRLLYGVFPSGDAELVRLADELDGLERQVSRR